MKTRRVTVNLSEEDYQWLLRQSAGLNLSLSGAIEAALDMSRQYEEAQILSVERQELRRIKAIKARTVDGRQRDFFSVHNPWAPSNRPAPEFLQ